MMNTENGISSAQVSPVSIRTQRGLRIHAIQTGFVAVKRAHRQLSVPAILRLPAILADRRWTEWMPIYAWAIEHPEGVIVVDTGESAAAANDPTFFDCDPRSAFVYKRILRLEVMPDDELGVQLRGLGLEPDSVRWVVQTHLHSDHADGMAAFPNAEFMVSSADYPSSMGAVPCLWPNWFNPSPVTFEPRRYYGFEEMFSLTNSEDVLIVPTPGHSPGHQSVIVVDDEQDVMIAGDASFNVEQVWGEVVAGISADVRSARATLRTIKQHLQQRPTIYLPSHDPSSAERLRAGSITEA